MSSVRLRLPLSKWIYRDVMGKFKVYSIKAWSPSNSQSTATQTPERAHINHLGHINLNTWIEHSLPDASMYDQYHL
jgi:hypothetical protein